MSAPTVIDRCYRAARRFIPVDVRAHDCAIAAIVAFLAATREPSEAMILTGDGLQTDECGEPCAIQSAAVLWRAMHAVLARELGVEP